MPIILGAQKISGAPYVQRKIRCPGHYLIPPDVDIYVREPVPELKHVSSVINWQGKRLNMKKTRRAKDKFGRYIFDWKKIYELRKKGIIIQPWVTAAFAIEHVYDPLSNLCAQCDKRCKEGIERVNERGIKRLNG